MSEDVASAIARFGQAALKMGAALRYLSFKMQLAFVRTPKDRRRLERDWARMNRRPALIHNGRKP